MDAVAVQNPEPAVVQATAPSTDDGAHRFLFQDMRLAVGDKLQLSPPSTVSGNRSVVPLIGYVEGVTLIVGAPPAGQWRPPLIEGDQVAVRVFSGQNALSFTQNIYGTDTPLALQAVIRSAKPDTQEAEGAWRLGIEFSELKPNDVATLHSLIYQELVEHPHNLV